MNILVEFASHMSRATKDARTSHLSKDPHLPYKIGEDPVSSAQGRSALLGGPLHPHPLTSYNV